MRHAISFLSVSDGGVRNAGKKSKEEDYEKEEEIIQIFSFF